MVLHKLSVSHQHQEFSLNSFLQAAYNFCCYSTIHRKIKGQTQPMAARYILRTLYGVLSICSEFCITLSKGIKCLRVRKIGLIPERLV